MSNIVFLVGTTLQGTPTNFTWPEGLRLASRINFRFPLVPHGSIPFERIITRAPSSAINLLDSLLKMDPSKRLSAPEALEHIYFDSAGKKIQPLRCPYSASNTADDMKSLQKVERLYKKRDHCEVDLRSIRNNAPTLSNNHIHDHINDGHTPPKQQKLSAVSSRVLPHLPQHVGISRPGSVCLAPMFGAPQFRTLRSSLLSTRSTDRGLSQNGTQNNYITCSSSSSLSQDGNSDENMFSNVSSYGPKVPSLRRKNPLLSLSSAQETKTDTALPNSYNMILGGTTPSLASQSISSLLSGKVGSDTFNNEPTYWQSIAGTVDATQVDIPNSYGPQKLSTLSSIKSLRNSTGYHTINRGEGKIELNGSDVLSKEASAPSIGIIGQRLRNDHRFGDQVLHRSFGRRKLR